MKDELAGRLLDELMDWSDAEQAEWMAQLRQLAANKYDYYEGFSPGERFFESLARWLFQFKDPADRRRLLTFVREELVFISRDELNHAIACVYPDVIKPDLVATVAAELGVPRWRTRRIINSVEFLTLRRKTLYLGLSDGARLDRLRRSSPELSHEQFWLTPELGSAAQGTMVEKLQKAIAKLGLLGEPRFRRVVFVDDFYGSGTSLLREERENGAAWAGKLARARPHMDKLIEQDVLEADPHVSVVLYLASAQAEQHVRSALSEFEPTWDLWVVQQIPEEAVVDDPDLRRLCDRFFDPVLIDEHKGRVPFGYGAASLALVLHHNTPNNSICLLWADTTKEAEGASFRALFPRYERHHVDRP